MNMIDKALDVVRWVFVLAAFVAAFYLFAIAVPHTDSARVRPGWLSSPGCASEGHETSQRAEAQKGE